MSKLAFFYINKPLTIFLQIFVWTSKTLLLKILGTYGTIYCVIINSIFLEFQTKTRLFIRMNPRKKDIKKFLGLFFTLIYGAIQDISLGYKVFLELRGVGFKVYRVERRICLEVGFSHKVFVPLLSFLHFCVLNKKKTKFLIQGFHRHLVCDYAHQIQNYKFPDVYTLKGIHYKLKWMKKKPGKQAQQK